MPRKKTYPTDAARAAAAIARLEESGGRRVNITYTPEAAAAVDLIKAHTGERHDSHVVRRLLVDEADRIIRRKQ